MIITRRFQMLLDAFFDGFGFTGLFTRVSLDFPSVGALLPFADPRH
jgi:hypothetical protein